MKKILCAAAACVLIVLCSCSNAVSGDDRFPASIGSTTFDHVPKKVISLSPAITETLYCLGYGGRLVGVSDYCSVPTEAKKLPCCGNALLPDIEDIIELKPDLIFSSALLSAKDRDLLGEAGIKTVVVEHAETTQGVIENYRLICTAFEGREKADLMAEQLSLFAQTTLDYIEDELKSRITVGETSAIYLRKMPFIIATGDTLEGAFIERLGFLNQADGFTSWSYPSEYESELNPNYIFCDNSVSIEALQKSEYYKRTSAVTNSRVYALDAKLFERQSPRMFFELERAMKEAFPEGFESPKPSFVLKMEPPAEPEKSWWEKLFSK